MKGKAAATLAAPAQVLTPLSEELVDDAKESLRRWGGLKVSPGPSICGMPPPGVKNGVALRGVNALLAPLNARESRRKSPSRS